MGKRQITAAHSGKHKFNCFFRGERRRGAGTEIKQIPWELGARSHGSHLGSREGGGAGDLEVRPGEGSGKSALQVRSGQVKVRPVPPEQGEAECQHSHLDH